MRINAKKLLCITLIAWIAIWINFIIRDMIKGKRLEEYKALITRDAQGKASYTYGERLFELLKFSAEEMPLGAEYELRGVEYSSIDFRRAVYYLYPNMCVSEADYILVLDEPGYSRDGYRIFKSLDSGRFILKRNI